MMNKTNHSLPARPLLGALLLAFAVLAAACGGSDGTTASDDSMAMEDESTMDHSSMDDDEMDHSSMSDGDMDHSAMNMGDADATPASDVAGADLSSGSFILLDTRPQGYDAVTGTADLARHDNGTTVTIQLAGLPPGVDMISHLHESGCADYGGDHFQFERGGSEMPPNEVHLAFTSAADGTGFMTAENDQTVGDDAVAIVVHPADLLDNKVVCADFSS